MNIALIGMPGSGKSTVGERLAHTTGRRFLDIDRLLEIAHGKTIADLLRSEGEVKFMAIEEKQILELKEIYNAVIAPGGSVVYSEKAILHMRSISEVLFLDVGLKDIVRRIGIQPRGIVGLGEMGMEELYRQRKKLYEKSAHINVEVPSGQSEDDTLKSVIGALLGVQRHPAEPAMAYL
jgi:shikimate kinase